MADFDDEQHRRDLEASLALGPPRDLMMPLALVGPQPGAGAGPSTLEATAQRSGELVRLVLSKRADAHLAVHELTVAGAHAWMPGAPMPGDTFDVSAFPPTLSKRFAAGDRVALRVSNLTRLQWWVRLLAWASRLFGRRILSRWDDRYSADVRAVILVRVS